jgi:hypothetical protein
MRHMKIAAVAAVSCLFLSMGAQAKIVVSAGKTVDSAIACSEKPGSASFTELHVWVAGVKEYFDVTPSGACFLLTFTEIGKEFAAKRSAVEWAQELISEAPSPH